MVALGGGVPIAVPFVCLNVISPNTKKLFNMTNLSASINALFCFGRISFIDVRICLAMSIIAVLVGMFVYIEITSAVKSCAVGWYCVEQSSWRMSKLFRKYETCCFASVCNFLSVQMPRGCSRLPGHATIGRLLRRLTICPGLSLWALRVR